MYVYTNTYPYEVLSIYLIFRCVLDTSSVLVYRSDVGTHLSGTCTVPNVPKARSMHRVYSGCSPSYRPTNSPIASYRTTCESDITYFTLFLKNDWRLANVLTKIKFIIFKSFGSTSNLAFWKGKLEVVEMSQLRCPK